MDQNRNENWQDLCKAAANELDPKKLMDLIVELNKALGSGTANGRLLRTQSMAEHVSTESAV